MDEASFGKRAFGITFLFGFFVFAEHIERRIVDRWVVLRGAVQNVDIPIMAAYLLLIAFLFVVINLAVDLLYAVVDPRLRVRT